MREIEIVGGTPKPEAAMRLVEHARATGETACCVFGNVHMMANPGQTAEKVVERYNEDVYAKSSWFSSPEGLAFIASRSRQKPG